MPGITGIFGLDAPEENASLLYRMIGPMKHEDFYSFDRYANCDLGVFSALVTSKGSHPSNLVWNEPRTIGCLISGDAFGSSGAQADLIDLYEEFGLRALERLNGWFSGVLIDLQRRMSILFNDRYGLNRVYVHEQDGRLFFSSEAKSLLAVLPAQRELDPRGLGEWFSCGCVLGNRSLFRGVSLLPPGSAWIFSSDNGLNKKRYFHPSAWETLPVLSAEDYYQQLTTVFPRILGHYTNGSRPVAMSLTGGLDGRMIMA